MASSLWRHSTTGYAIVYAKQSSLRFCPQNRFATGSLVLSERLAGVTSSGRLLCVSRRENLHGVGNHLLTMMTHRACHARGFVRVSRGESDNIMPRSIREANSQLKAIIYDKAGGEVNLDRAMSIYLHCTQQGDTPTVDTYLLMITIFSLADRPANALALLTQLKQRGFKVPSVRTYNALLRACARAHEVEAALAISDMIMEDGHQPTVHTFAFMIDVFAVGMASASTRSRSNDIGQQLQQQQSKEARVIRMNDFQKVDKCVELLQVMRRLERPAFFKYKQVMDLALQYNRHHLVNIYDMMVADNYVPLHYMFEEVLLFLSTAPAGKTSLRLPAHSLTKYFSSSSSPSASCSSSADASSVFSSPLTSAQQCLALLTFFHEKIQQQDACINPYSAIYVDDITSRDVDDKNDKHNNFDHKDDHTDANHQLHSNDTRVRTGGYMHEDEYDADYGAIPPPDTPIPSSTSSSAFPSFFQRNDPFRPLTRSLWNRILRGFTERRDFAGAQELTGLMRRFAIPASNRTHIYLLQSAFRCWNASAGLFVATFAAVLTALPTCSPALPVSLSSLPSYTDSLRTCMLLLQRAQLQQHSATTEQQESWQDVAAAFIVELCTFFSAWSPPSSPLSSTAATFSSFSPNVSGTALRALSSDQVRDLLGLVMSMMPYLYPHISSSTSFSFSSSPYISWPDFMICAPVLMRLFASLPPPSQYLPCAPTLFPALSVVSIDQLSQPVAATSLLFDIIGSNRYTTTQSLLDLSQYMISVCVRYRDPVSLQHFLARLPLAASQAVLERHLDAITLLYSHMHCTEQAFAAIAATQTLPSPAALRAFVWSLFARSHFHLTSHGGCGPSSSQSSSSSTARGNQSQPLLDNFFARQLAELPKMAPGVVETYLEYLLTAVQKHAEDKPWEGFDHNNSNIDSKNKLVAEYSAAILSGYALLLLPPSTQLSPSVFPVLSVTVSEGPRYSSLFSASSSSQPASLPPSPSLSSQQSVTDEADASSAFRRLQSLNDSFAIHCILQLTSLLRSLNVRLPAEVWVAEMLAYCELEDEESSWQCLRELWREQQQEAGNIVGNDASTLLRLPPLTYHVLNHLMDKRLSAEGAQAYVRGSTNAEEAAFLATSVGVGVGEEMSACHVAVEDDVVTMDGLDERLAPWLHLSHGMMGSRLHTTRVLAAFTGNNSSGSMSDLCGKLQTEQTVWVTDVEQIFLLQHRFLSLIYCTSLSPPTALPGRYYLQHGFYRLLLDVHLPIAAALYRPVQRREVSPLAAAIVAGNREEDFPSQGCHVVLSALMGEARTTRSHQRPNREQVVGHNPSTSASTSSLLPWQETALSELPHNGDLLLARRLVCELEEAEVMLKVMARGSIDRGVDKESRKFSASSFPGLVCYGMQSAALSHLHLRLSPSPSQQQQLLNERESTVVVPVSRLFQTRLNRELQASEHVQGEKEALLLSALLLCENMLEKNIPVSTATMLSLVALVRTAEKKETKGVAMLRSKSPFPWIKLARRLLALAQAHAPGQEQPALLGPALDLWANPKKNLLKADKKGKKGKKKMKPSQLKKLLQWHEYRKSSMTDEYVK